jgi:hypothetical protein
MSGKVELIKPPKTTTATAGTILKRKCLQMPLIGVIIAAILNLQPRIYVYFTIILR